jgi:phage baseplate assembly protein gpV
MNNVSDLKMHGSLELVLQRENGEVETRRKDNIIVNGGFDFICACLGNAGSRPAVASHIAVGTSTTAPAATQTALLAESARVAAAYAHTNGTKVFTMTATFPAGTATSGGTMLDRVTFAVINKGANDTLTATFTFTLS